MTAYSVLPGKRASYAVHQKPGDRHHVIQDVISLFTETSSSENPSPEPRALVRAKTSEYLAYPRYSLQVVLIFFCLYSRQIIYILENILEY